VLREVSYQLLTPNPVGIFRSPFFAGLWLDTAALLRGDLSRVFAVVHQGLQHPDHASFVARLKEG